MLQRPLKHFTMRRALQRRVHGRTKAVWSGLGRNHNMKTATKKTKKVRIRTFRGLPLRDATHDLLLQVTNSDKKKGIPKDPEHCAMAVSWCRMAGDPQAEAVIGRGIAHIKMRDEDGMWFWCRFRLTELTALRARKFDRTGIADEAGYRLTAPSISQNLDYRLILGKRKSNVQVRGGGIIPSRSRSRAHFGIQRECSRLGLLN